MAEKIASGAWHEGGPASNDDEPDAIPPSAGRGADSSPERSEIARLTARRDSARWYAVVGFGMLFAASFNVGFAIGGSLMIVYGAAASIFWSTKLRRVKGDPWAYDPELDAHPESPFYKP